MKAQALVPTLALAAALLTAPVAQAAPRNRPYPGHRPPAHGYYGQRPGYPSHGYHGYGYRSYRPYYPSYRYYAPPAPYYGSGWYGYEGYPYGYGGYGYGGYGYYPPPPPRYCPPRARVGVGFWFGF
jgi:hypothetical protein